MKISILGDGAWGTACATLFAYNGHDVTLWCFNKEVAYNIETRRVNNLYLPNIKLSPKIKPTLDLEKALISSNFICEAIPVKFLRSILTNCKQFIKENIPWVILSKGIESGSLLLPSQIIENILGPISYAVLSGPSFAYDLAQKQITAVNLASTDLILMQNLQKIVNNNYFTTIINNDPIGTQICGALKNIIAIILGMLTAAGYQDNTKAFIITQSLKELTLLVKLMGGAKETVYDLAGVGDLLLTSVSEKSKNFNIGKKIFVEHSLEKICDSTNTMPEGINTIKSLKTIIDKYKADTPLFKNIHEVIFDKQIDIKKLFRNLL